MNVFSFSIPSKVSFGISSINTLPDLLPENTKRVLIVNEDIIENQTSAKRIEDILARKGTLSIIYDEIGPGADSKKIEEIVNLARNGKVEAIIGLGGMKVLSIAKLASLLVYSRQTVYDLIDGSPVTSPSLKYIAIPTMPGCSFLLNARSYITDARNRNPVVLNIKNSEAHAVIFDPELSESLSKKYTIAILMRILLSSTEGLFSGKSSFLSDNFFYRSIKAALESLSSIDTDSSAALNSASKSGLLNAMGHTISSPGIGSAVSFALNSEYNLPKSLIASIILPYILEEGMKLSSQKMFELGKVLGIKSDSSDPAIIAEDTVNHIRRAIADFEIPLRLGTYNIKNENIEKISEKILSLEIAENFPHSYTAEDISELIRKLL